MFEKAFGLAYDADAGLYLINDTQHDALVALDASITFSFTQTGGIGYPGFPVVNITLPYAAFDL
jgi:hypothetical protein